MEWILILILILAGSTLKFMRSSMFSAYKAGKFENGLRGDKGCTYMLALKCE